MRKFSFETLAFGLDENYKKLLRKKQNKRENKAETKHIALWLPLVIIIPSRILWKNTKPSKTEVQNQLHTRGHCD